jgi:serine phosphatase RsbU (regulator of sigma subunit)
MEASHTLWQINKTIGNSDKALQMHELYVKVKDSLGSENNRMEIIKKEFELQYEKQVAADSIKSSESDKLKDAQISREQAENKQQRVQTYFLLGGLLLTFISGGLFYNRYRLTHRQKKIIELQKSKVDIAYQTLELKNREITDSIKYATRIQHAILPPKKRVAQLLPDSFILFKPKDIVAGDFYWLETADLNSGNADEDTRSTVLLAAADCTGHGVPGAMVSVICNNGLNRAVREHGIKDPGKILDKARTIIIQEFEKSEEEVNDGMDISLCSLTYAGTDGHLSLQWAGANNPLWIFRNNEVIEIKPDKQPIGNYTDSKPFTTHTFQLQKSDTLYIFTDGFQDQFGGEKGKKFKASNLKKLLLSIQHETMTRQLELISEAFEAWKGNLEQNDDVCLIGVRV